MAAACGVFLTAEGLPVSAQTTWQILDTEGIGRLARRDEGRRGPPAKLDPVQAARLAGWPTIDKTLPSGRSVAG